MRDVKVTWSCDWPMTSRVAKGNALGGAQLFYFEEWRAKD